MKIHLATGRTLNVEEGESVIETLKRAEIFLSASCGGKGTCSKCKIKLKSGRARITSSGKLTKAELGHGIALACQTFPDEDIHIEIPDESRLVVGDKIAIGRSRELFELFQVFGARLEPIVKKMELRLQPPSIEDHIGDLDRIKRALAEKGIEDMRFSLEFTRHLSDALRKYGWDIFLAHTEDKEAIIVSPNEPDIQFGIAVDIGTTTVVVNLIDVETGRIIDVGSTYNSQIRFGDDVITRIIHAAENRGMPELRKAIQEDINNILRAICGKHCLEPDDIGSAVISANTTMTHLFWGLTPAYIREEPYIPAINSFPLWRAGAAGIRINPQAPVYTMPCIASYVGGDIVSGVLASRLTRSDEIALFMDIGTNGEIAVGNKDWLLAAACSAGPCFEGGGIRHGMRATDGAIEKISLDPKTLEPSISVIGDSAPVGICGSGMIDAISEMFLKKVIDGKGRFDRGLLKSRPNRVRQCEEGIEFVFHDGPEQSVGLTEIDIENIMRAKAAIFAGVRLLLKEVDLPVEAIDRIYIAGGFGSYIDVEKAIILGMLPDMPRERFSYKGNTSIAGAYLALLSEDLRKEAESIASKMTYVELSVSRGFMDEYMSALFLPHTDLSLFPTVSKKAKGL